METIKVKDFYLHSKQKMPLEVIAENGGMRRVIHETTLNRPGLAMVGFYEHFAHRRIQVLGMAEYDFFGE